MTLGRGRQDTHPPRRGAGRGGKARHHRLPHGCGVPSTGRPGRPPGQRGYGSGLDDPDPPVGVDEPFQVLGASVMAFRCERHRGDRPHGIVVHHGGGHLRHGCLLAPVPPVGTAHDLEILAAGGAVHHGEIRLRDGDRLGYHRTGDRGLSLTTDRLQHQVIEIPGHGICREHDPRRHRGDHVVHDDRHDRLAGEIQAGPIGDHARGEERGPAPLDCGDHVLLTRDVGERRVHPGERREGTVFPDRRGPDRHRCRVGWSE